MNQPLRPGMRQSKFANAPAANKEETVDDIIQRGRMLAEHNVRSFIPGLRASNIIIEPRIPTIGIDKYWRTYWNPRAVMWMVRAANAVSKTSPCHSCGAVQHHKYAYIAGIWIHEIGHQIFRHRQRMEEAGFTDLSKGNIAQDAEMNDDIPEIGQAAEKWGAQPQNDSPTPAMCIPSRAMVDEAEYTKWNKLGTAAFKMLTGRDMWDVYHPVGAGAAGMKEIPFLVFPDAVPTAPNTWLKLDKHKIFEVYYESIPDPTDSLVTLVAYSQDKSGNLSGQATCDITFEHKPFDAENSGVGSTK